MPAKRDIRIYLQDIFEAADLIEKYVEDISEDDFLKNFEKQDAVLRRIQIIGEAAKHVSEDYRKKWNHIPWKEIAGMRDIIVHEYFGVTMEMIWKVAVEDIPKLKRQIEDLL